MDSGKAVALILLDLSAAFDTIDHTILFNCLRDWFGMDGTVLMWIKSYLTNRRQKVKLGNSFSDAFSLPYWVPQGSVLGPLLFTLYTTPLSHIIKRPARDACLCIGDLQAPPAPVAPPAPHFVFLITL